MKNALIIAFLILSTIASATDYYISSSGNDTNNGLSSSTPWKTIAKVNSEFSIMKPSDRILFNRGDTFYGSITVTKSGSAGSPITIGAYGTGVKPIITGFTTVSAWTNLGSNIWESTSAVSTLSTCNMVTINGVNTGMGRYPNTGYLTYQTYSGNTSITSSSLSGTPNWTGAEVVIKKQRWIIDRNRITGQSGGTLTYTPSSTYYGRNNWGFFIQNDASTLDKVNEWYYNPSTKKIRVYSTSSPISVKVASVDTLVFINYNNYITFDNISFIGANNCATYLKNCTNITIQYCDFNFCYNGILGNSTNFNLQNCTINHSNNNALGLSTMANATISNNIIKNTGMIPGMGESGDDTYMAMRLGNLSNALIQYNEIDSSGYNGIYLPGGNSITLTNNLINYFCMIKDDGGGIYTHTAATGKIISFNIVLNGIGNDEGVNDPGSSEVMGIYIDRNFNTSGVQILNNSIANIGNGGIFLNGTHDIVVSGNTVYNSNLSAYRQSAGDAGDEVSNIEISNNIFFAQKLTQLTFFANAYNQLIGHFTSNNNYYARPTDDNKTFELEFDGPTYDARFYNLSEWQTFSGQDANSHKSPITITNTNDIRFEYNASKTNKIIVLDQPMIDVKGLKFVNSITLLPFTSVVLMVDPNPAQPVIPVYTGSVIGNTTPALLEMTYNQNLANIVPAASAFTVTVNSVARSVNSIAILGTKVQLTLSSPVVNGNLVTVAYTKPSTNALQSTSGGQAASFSAQAVTNNVNTPTLPVYVSSAIENATPSLLVVTYNMTLANLVPVASAFSVNINSALRTVNTVTVSGTKVQLSLASPIVYGDVVTFSYTKPATNALQTTSGGQVASFSAQPVVNNCINVAPTAVITSPISNSSFTASANIMITANASDPDGSVSIVEFYNGSTKLGSKSAAPYSFTWNNVLAGTYSLTVVATDNLNAKTISSAILISIINGSAIINQPPVISISNPQKGNTYEPLATITINAVASDPDGTISKVEFYSGSDKLVELTSPPYSYTWKDVKAGTYSITATATDNLNATTTSSPIEFEVGTSIKYDADSKIINLYPNPSDGHFSIKFINPLQNDKSEIIINDLAGKQIYNGFVSKEETLKQFDLSNSNPGIYIMMIKNKEILVTKKIIKN